MNKIGLCIGHGRSGDSGAVTTTGISEVAFNTPIAHVVSDNLNAIGYQARVWDYYEGNGYGEATTWIANELNAWGADVATELHFNSASPSAQGFEHLYWGTSSEGQRLAKCFCDAQEMLFPGRTNRGEKSKNSSDRGSGFLSKPAAVCAILEPFFGSNSEETSIYTSEDGKAKLIKAYTDALVDFFGGLV